MTKPLISVVMSVYNTEHAFLKESISSIINQTYSNFEFIIIDDNSIEPIDKIIESFKDSRIKLLKNEMNQGLTKNLNVGIGISQGKYIARMDSDDISLPTRFQKQVDYLEKNTEIGVLGTYASKIGDRFSKLKPPIHHNQIKTSLLVGNIMIHPTVMIRKELLRDDNYNENFRTAQDYELWSRLIWKTKFSNLPETLLNYRVHKAQITFTQNESQISNASKSQETLFRKIFDDFGESIEIDMLYKSTGMLPLMDSEEYYKLKNICKELIQMNNSTNTYPKEYFKETLIENYDRSLYIFVRDNKKYPAWKVLFHTKIHKNKFAYLKFIAVFYKPTRNILEKAARLLSFRVY